MRRCAAILALSWALLLSAPAAGRTTPAAAPLRPWAGDELEQYQQRLAQLFRQLDRDGNGRLERDEVRANPYLQRHFQRLDRGGKGYLLPADLR